MNYIIKNISSLLQVRDYSIKKVAGKEMSILPSIENAFLKIEDGLIKSFGSMSDYIASDINNSYEEVDAKDGMVLPAWCDSHTHIVFADWRETEFRYKVAGKSYEEIAKRGGGILNSANVLNNTSEEILFERAMDRISEVIQYGTGAIEIKSGYGLSTKSELKMLRVIKEIKKHSPIQVKSTFLGAHAFPLEYKNNHEGYLKILIDEMLPAIAEDNLADYCDVFCDRGFFSAEETDRILKAAYKYGLKPKIHANEMDFSGGIQIGVENHAISVDHLECVDQSEIDCLLNSNTMPTLLPTTAFFLGLQYPPARKMIDSGLPIALATDYNPGSSPNGRMSFVLSLACSQMKMSPEEVINASTMNGAAAMELESVLGSITIGKKANIIITKPIKDIAMIPYRFGSDIIQKVIIS
jgi:imidazolonepropionase